MLKDSLSLMSAGIIIILANAEYSSDDVAELYQWTNIEDCMKALQWFMTEHSSIPLNPSLQPNTLRLLKLFSKITVTCTWHQRHIHAKDKKSNGHIFLCYVCYYFHDLIGNTHYQ